MMKEAWEKAWDETPPEVRRRTQRWGPPKSKGQWACRLNGERNQCGTCGHFFTGTKSFDRHRTGPWGKQGVPSKRRCLTIPEMIEKGFTRNEYFYWTIDGASVDDENGAS